MKITQNFTLEELCHSDTAITLGLDNTPKKYQIEGLERLCKTILQPLRDVVGSPIKVLSGYRSPNVNKAVGGAATSYHLQGLAVDISLPNKSLHFDGLTIQPNMTLVYYILLLQLPFDKMILEYGQPDNPSWVHIQIAIQGNQPRNQIFRKELHKDYERIFPMDILKLSGAI